MQGQQAITITAYGYVGMMYGVWSSILSILVYSVSASCSNQTKTNISTTVRRTLPHCIIIGVEAEEQSAHSLFASKI